MAVTATSSLALHMHRLRDSLSASTKFLEKINGGTAQLALNHIFFDYADDPESITNSLPYAVISPGEWGYSQVASGPYLQARGTIQLRLASLPVSPENHADCASEFWNWAIGVIDQLASQAGTDLKFEFHNATMEQRPVRTARSKQSDDNDYWWTEWVLTVDPQES